MPRRRKKSSRSTRKPPLAFSESPLEVSCQFASPVTGATNPVTAEIISLHDLPIAKWVSPQFDPNATPVIRRRRGRRRQNTDEIRTACSQNPNRKKEALADVSGQDGTTIRGSDRHRSDLQVDKVLTDMTGLAISGNVDRGGKSSDDSIHSESSDKENDMVAQGPDIVGFVPGHSTIYGGGIAGSSAMRLCSSLFGAPCVGGVPSPAGTPTCIARTNFDGACRRPRSGSGHKCPSGVTPLSEVNGGVKGQPVSCPACEGTCRPLVNDTPVNEYNLRVPMRNRRGRLPKAAWEQLISDVS